MSKKKFIASVLLGVSATVISAAPAIAAKNDNTEKCYGIVKAGKNDCADAKGMHSCAGGSKMDSNKSDWISLPKGACEKIVGGTLNAAK